LYAHLIIPRPGKENRKTGRMPVAYVARESCPPSCALLSNGCYAESYPVRTHWDKVSLGLVGTSWHKFCFQIAVHLEPDQIWRYGVAGDLPGPGEFIDRKDLDELTTANMGRPVLAYTHKPVLDCESLAIAAHNRRAIAEALEDGFLINLSGNNPAHADELAELQLAPVVTVLPEAYARRRRSLGGGKKEWTETIGEYRDRTSALPSFTSKGRRIAVCPATYSDATCASCRACAHSRNGTIIGFPAHGTAKRKAEAVAARDVPAGTSWAFRDHRTMAQVIADEAAASADKAA
jgi:hypothetical protein